MSVNGITNGTLSDVYGAYRATAGSDKESKVSEETKAAEESKSSASAAAVYEPSEEKANDVPRKLRGADPALVAQLKADQEQRQNQLQKLVAEMLGKQANTASIADDMWKFLAKGDFEVDAETKAQAQADISEDGYWGVKQTSDRILDFAVALAGQDKDSLEKMRDAFKKGYAQAEETWGGKLPDISKQTYDAVMKGFDELLNPTEETQ